MGTYLLTQKSLYLSLFGGLRKAPGPSPCAGELQLSQTKRLKLGFGASNIIRLSQRSLSSAEGTCGGAMLNASTSVSLLIHCRSTSSTAPLGSLYSWGPAFEK